MVSPVSIFSSLVGQAGSVGAIRPGSAAPSAAAALNGPDFGTVLANVSAEAMNTLKAGEATALSGIEGQASAQEVVQAIMSAEETLQTALAIRDKVVSAYQEISRMSI